MAEFLEVASRELNDAARWYEDHQPGLGGRFLMEAKTATRRIENMPLAGSPWVFPSVPQGVRRVFLATFPYALVYVTDPRLVVVAVAHAKRHPAYWVERITELDKR